MSDSFQVISPIDASVYLERRYSSQADLKELLSKIRQVQTKWAEVSISQRADICLKAVTWMLDHKTEIAEEITRQMGRPVRYGAGEVLGFADRARYMIDIAEEKLQAIICEDSNLFHRFIKREPLGTVLSIVPWNYPLLTAVNSLIPALMAGNTVIMKSSSQTPLVGERLQQAFEHAQLPPGVFQNVLLTHANTESLVQQAEIDFVSFTGSVNGGRALQGVLRSRFIGSAMELGGKDPAYVRPDADIAFTVENLVDGAFFNSGQSCCGIERIYVHEAVYDPFVEQFVALVKQYCLGDPLQHQTTLGPMVNARVADHVRFHIKDAVSKGATLCIDPADFSNARNEGPYLAPQVLVNVDHSMSVMTEESFGPVVGIAKVNSDEQAVQLMNDSNFGLTASVWTKDHDRALQLGEQVETGTWFMNRCDYLDPALSWSGCKLSGRGCSLSEIGYEQLTRPKSFHLRRQ